MHGKGKDGQEGRPTSSKSPLGTGCAECEAWMADALDGELTGPLAENFQSHLNVCSACRSRFQEIQDGLSWMKSLDEVEPPSSMLHNILAATLGTNPMPAPAAKKTFIERLREMSLLAPAFRIIRALDQRRSPWWLEPRFAMSFGIAFFSISLLLNLTGVKLASVRNLDLRPSALVRGYYETQGKIVKYYDNARVVLEVESRVHDLKRALTSDGKSRPGQDGSDQDDKEKDQNRDTSSLQNNSLAKLSVDVGGSVAASTPGVDL